VEVRNQKARVAAGEMEGLWTVWDSRGTRTAEIRYHHGQPSGEYRLYFSALAFPNARRTPKALGQIP